MDEFNQNAETLVITNEIRSYLKEVSKWAKFLAILGFIGCGLGLIAVCFMLFAFSALDQSEFSDLPSALPFAQGSIAFIYLILIGIYFIPLYYLYKFSATINSALKLDDQSKLNSGFEFLKKHYKFIGIMTIVLLCLYVLLLLTIPFWAM